MQGQLTELDIRSILQLIALGQRTGELYVETYLPSSHEPWDKSSKVSRSWFAFFDNGQLIYAGETQSQLQRLQDYLHAYQIPLPLETQTLSHVALFNSLEYGMLWSLLEQRLLAPEQGRNLLHKMIEETVFDLLSLRQGSFVFRMSPALTPQLTTFEIAPLVSHLTQQIQAWHLLHPIIQSVHQCPLWVSDQAPAAMSRLKALVDGKTSILQMARYLNQDSLIIASKLHPLIKQGLLTLSPLSEDATPEPTALSRSWSRDRVPRVVCIDDGASIRQTIESILDRYGYEATSIGNPLKALSLLFQLKPDLILCDIAMPELEGHQLCAMLRQSVLFRETPIVMLTGHTGFIDRVKARMAGATDYLTKPFGEQELLMLVEKYVGQGNPGRTQPERLLAEEIADVLAN
jgi:twitching motility two-component system response regulator PilG